MGCGYLVTAVVWASLAYCQGVSDPQLVMLLTDVRLPAAIFKIIVPGLNTTNLFISHLSSPMAIDYDMKGKHIYWVDSGAKQDRRSDIDGGNPQAVASLSSSSVSEGLTLDGNTSQVFYTDDGNDVIVRIEMDIFLSTEIVSGLLERPRGIVADTKNRNLYWVDFGLNEKVETCNYNGGSRRTVVSERLLYPYGIAIDEQGACPYGQYGLECKPCGKCINRKFCEKTTGMCFGGCAPGYKKDLCLQVCDPGTYGDDCAFMCSVNCKKGSVCDHVTGQCPVGCQPGWMGDNCTTINAGGMGSDLSTGAIAGIAVVGIVVIVIIIVAVVCSFTRKERSQNSLPGQQAMPIPQPITRQQTMIAPQTLSGRETMAAPQAMPEHQTMPQTMLRQQPTAEPEGQSATGAYSKLTSWESFASNSIISNKNDN